MIKQKLKQKQLLKIMTTPFLILSLLISLFTGQGIQVNAETLAVQATKTVSNAAITPSDEVEVKLDIKGTPPTNVVLPNDVILIIDKSGSMSLPYAPVDKMQPAKDAAKNFIDLMDFTAHQVGVVDFSDVSKIRTSPLTTDGASAKQFIDTIVAGGGTYTGDAIRTAEKALANHRSEAQPVIVLMTDGQATKTDDALAAAIEARNAGIVFYTIALLNQGENPDTSAPNELLKQMATTSQHHHFVLGATGLNEIYAGIVKEIGVSSAKNVVVTDTVSPQFEIIPGSYDQNIPKPTVNGNTLTWDFLELKDQTLSFTYKVRPVSKDVTGIFPISSGSNIQYKDYLGNAKTVSISSTDITIKFPKPDITAVTPDKSEIAGGSEITLQGTNFKQGAVVKVNSVAATNVQVISENEIKATVPAGTQGKAVIRVTNTDGQYDEQDFNYFANPVVTSITPNKGLTQGGTSVAIAGKYFLQGAKVFFNNVEATTAYVSGQSLSVKTPKSDLAGAVDVKVVNPDASEVVVPGGFTYEMAPAPTITSLSKTSGLISGGDLVIVKGTGFQNGLTVKLGGLDSKVNDYYDSTSIRIVIPQGAAEGAADLVITNPDGQSASSASAYTYMPLPTVSAPTITSLSKTSGLISGGDLVTVKGTGFQSGLTVKLGGLDAKVSNYYDLTSIRIVIPQGVAEGAADLVITNPDGQNASLAGAYTYMPLPTVSAPTITSLSKTSGLISGGDLVIVKGTGFQSGLTVKLGGLDAKINAYYDSTSIRIVIPQGAAQGVADLVVTNPDGQSASLAGAYTYTALSAPTVTSLSKITGYVTGGDYVIITGTNFQSGIAAKIGGLDAIVANYYGATSIRIAIPKTISEGVAELVVTNPDGQSASLAGAYTYTAVPLAAPPTITSLGKTTGLISGGDLVMVKGTGFQSGITAKIGGLDAKVANYYDATSIRITIPKTASLGAVDLVVTNPDGQSASLSGAYTYAAPIITVTSISPSTGVYSGGSYANIYGTNFDSSTVVTVNGVSVSTTLTSSTQLKINAMPSGSALGLSAGGGVVTIIVTDSFGNSANANYTYQAKPTIPVPNITKIALGGGAAPTGSISGGTVVYVTGTGFTSAMKVRVYDPSNNLVSESSLRTFYDGTYCNITTPKVTVAGNYTIKFVNSDGIESNGMIYIYK